MLSTRCHKKSILTLCLVIMLVAALASCQRAAGVQTDSTAALAAEDAAAKGSSAEGAYEGWSSLAIDTTDLSGAAVTSADFAKNKLTMLNIWASWCPPCIGELPELQKVSEAFAEKGVQVVGVLQDGITELGKPDKSIIDDSIKLLEDAKADYLVILPDEAITLEFISKMQYFPTTFFIDSEGAVVHTAVGSKDFKNWSAEIDDVLEKLP